MDYKNLLLLTLVFCFRAVPASAVSFWEKIQADHTRKELSSEARTAIICAKQQGATGVAALSFTTLAGYGIKALVGKYQKRPLSFTKKHKAFASVATVLGMGALWLYKNLSAALTEPAQLPAANTATPQAAQQDRSLVDPIAEGKQLLADLANYPHKQPVLADFHDPNPQPFYGQELTARLSNFVKQYFALPEIKDFIAKLPEPEGWATPEEFLQVQARQKTFTFDELPELVKIGINLRRKLTQEHNTAINLRWELYKTGTPQSQYIPPHPRNIYLRGLFDVFDQNKFNNLIIKEKIA